MKNIIFSTVLAIGLGGFQGCTILRNFPNRSELTIKAQAVNPVDAKDGVRSVEATLELKGNNRDILTAFRNAMEFSIEQLGLKKK